jgi:RNA polymerase sigma-70 factor (ECF subfamily)
LLHYAFSLTGRRAVAEEIVQEVFLQLHARWDDVLSPRAWLIRCVRNQSYQWARNNRREGSSLSNLPEAIQVKAVVDQSLERLELEDRLRNALERLPERDRQLIQLKYFQNHTYRQISQVTGLTIGNVGFRLHRLLQQLAREFQGPQG